MARTRVPSVVSWTVALLVCEVAAPHVAAADSATIATEGARTQTAARFDCTHAVPDARLQVTSLAHNAVIPRNHTFVLVEWVAPTEYRGSFLLEVRSGLEELRVVTRRKSWMPDEGVLARFLDKGEFFVTVFMRDAGATRRSATVRVQVDDLPLTDRIAFREVQPLFDPTRQNALRVFTFGERVLATALAFKGTCIGCHGYAPAAVFLNVKRSGRRWLVTAHQEAGRVILNRADLAEFSFFTVASDGSRAAYVASPVGRLTVKDTVVEPFDYPYRSADIWIYDGMTGKSAPLPGASDPGWVEDMPSLSPDGRTLVFVRYRVEEGVEGIRAMELWQVPVNDGRGGEPTPLLEATPGAPWNYFPRYSPNGRWMSFCRGDATNGVYARRSSDIYLMSVATHAVTRLRLNVDGAMDSWHSWSSDSRWLAFSSNRERSGMTALYLARIGADGVDAPPVKLAGFTAAKVNTPQFVPAGVELQGLGEVGPLLDRSSQAPRRP